MRISLFKKLHAEGLITASALERFGGGSSGGAGAGGTY